MKGITGQTKLLGVFGHPVVHSLSPAMHNAALEELGLNCVYLPFDVDPAHLEQAVHAIRALGAIGVNVTIPHKEKVIPFLDEVSPQARLIGSVNTISNKDGRLLGESTDGEGFLQALKAVGTNVKGKRAVVIGAGGSSRAVTYALVSHGASVTVANRTLERGEELARSINEITSSDDAHAVSLAPEELKEAIEGADILVNSASMGMWPDVDFTPCPEELLHPGLLVYDLVYNPLHTKLLQAAERVGAATISGIKMLVYQGAISFKIWTGRDPSVDVMESAALAELTARQAPS
ncbi:MAG: shikimate dehydrogenase [Armatimonadota bacterium]|nr:shikimate dehydrogenase [Armatimonadota bacterium]